MMEDRACEVCKALQPASDMLDVRVTRVSTGRLEFVPICSTCLGMISRDVLDELAPGGAVKTVQDREAEPLPTPDPRVSFDMNDPSTWS